MKKEYKYDVELLMKQQSLFERVNNGAKVDVEIIEGIFEDMYLEPGMRATITSMIVDEVHGSESGPDSIILVTLDFSKFDDFNTPLESANYYDKNGEACLTATEAGQKPKSLQEDTYCSMSHFEFPFIELSNDSSKLYALYAKETDGISYIQWLENAAAQVFAPMLKD